MKPKRTTQKKVAKSPKDNYGWCDACRSFHSFKPELKQILQCKAK